MQPATHLSMDMAHNERMLAVQRRTSRETQESHSTSPSSQVSPVSFVEFVLLDFVLKQEGRRSVDWETISGIYLNPKSVDPSQLILNLQSSMGEFIDLFSEGKINDK